MALAVKDSIWSPAGGHSYSPRGIQLPLPHRDVYRHLLGAVDPILDLSTLKLPALIELQLIERQRYLGRYVTVAVRPNIDSPFGFQHG